MLSVGGVQDGRYECLASWRLIQLGRGSYCNIGMYTASKSEEEDGFCVVCFGERGGAMSRVVIESVNEKWLYTPLSHPVCVLSFLLFYLLL